MLLKRREIQGHALYRAAEIASFNPEARTVDLVMTTGYKGKRSNPWLGEEWFEELAVSKEAIRADRLNSGAPLLNSHGADGGWMGPVLSDVLGVMMPNTLRFETGTDGVTRAIATAKFSARDDVAAIMRDVQDGIIRNVSVGYRVYKWEETTADDDKIPTFRAVDWEICEVSLVPIGFDPGAGTRSAPVNVRSAEGGALPPTFAMEVNFKRSATSATKEGGQKPMTPEEKAAAEKLEQDKRAAEAAAKAQAEEARKAGAEAERARAAEITRAVRLVKLPDTFAEQLVKDGKSVDEARALILEEKAKESDKNPTDGTRRIDVGQSDIEKRAEAVENAIRHRADPVAHKLTDGGRQFRSMSVMEMARVHLEAQGVRTAGMTKHELATEALRKRSAHSTSDFPNILANVANKELLGAYDRIAARQTFRPMARTSNIPDFKQVARDRLGEMPKLLALPEGAEVTYGTVGESKEVYTLGTYARKFAISREALINDDLGAFTNLPSRFGFAAARLESDLVWAMVTGNPAMGDGTALFHADHGNQSGSAAAISVTTIGAGRAAMRVQKGLAALDPLNIVPKFLVVPAALETVADQFVSTALLASASGSVNPFAGRLTVISEARLDANSALKWYLSADPADGVDVFEIGYLDGQAGPKVETQMGWDTLGIEIRAVHDFGCKVLDWRGLYRNS